MGDICTKRTDFDMNRTPPVFDSALLPGADSREFCPGFFGRIERQILILNRIIFCLFYKMD